MSYAHRHIVGKQVILTGYGTNCCGIALRNHVPRFDDALNTPPQSVKSPKTVIPCRQPS